MVVVRVVCILTCEISAGDAFKSKNPSSAQREVEGFEAANAKIHGTVLSIQLLYPRGEDRRLNTRSEGMGWIFPWVQPQSASG